LAAPIVIAPVLRFLPLNVQQNNFNKVYRAKTPQVKILNPKHEILNNTKTLISKNRNTKQFQNLNSQNPKPSNENFSRVFKCFEISILSFPFLFRISDFVLRIYNFTYTWRALNFKICLVRI